MAVFSSRSLWTDLAVLKTWVKLRVPDVEHNDVLVDLANEVSEELEDLAGRVFRQRTVNEILDGDGTALIVLAKYPVGAPTVFTIDGVAVPAEDYVLDAATGLIRLPQRTLTPGMGNVCLTYPAGYLLTDIPARVLGVAKEMLKIKYDRWNQNAISLSSLSMGPATLNVRQGWPWDIQQAIDDLRRDRPLW